MKKIINEILFTGNVVFRAIIAIVITYYFFNLLATNNIEITKFFETIWIISAWGYILYPWKKLFVKENN